MLGTAHSGASAKSRFFTALRPVKATHVGWDKVFPCSSLRHDSSMSWLEVAWRLHVPIVDLGEVDTGSIATETVRCDLAQLVYPLIVHL